MKVPFLDLKTQYHSIKNEIDSAIENICENTSFILGKPVQDFESNFAKAHNVDHTIGLSSGTDGNHLTLWALGITKGDEVILPANTFIATAWGPTLCGAKPVFADCGEKSYNINPEEVEKFLTPRTKAIVAVHLYGQPADMDRLIEITEKHGIHLVEDSAQAHLAEYKGKKVGGLGIASSFSFFPGKNLGAFGEAGAVTTNNEELANKFKMMREHGSRKKYYHEIYGHNYRMEAMQGAILNIKLKYLEKWTNARCNVASKYNEFLSNIEGLVLPEEMSYAKHVYHLYVIQTEKRNELQKYLNDFEIATGLHYPIPLHLQNCFKELGYKKGDFPNTEKLSDNCLSLPIFPEMADDQISYVSEKIIEFFKK